MERAEWVEIVNYLLETVHDGPDKNHVRDFHRPIIGHLSRGEYLDAERTCRIQLESHEDSLLWTLYAMTIVPSCDGEEILKALQTAHDLSSELCITWNCMAYISLQLGHGFNTFFGFEASLLIHEAQTFPRKILYVLYKDRQMWDKAIEMAQGIIQVEPEKQGGWGILEEVLAELANQAQAVKIAREMTKEFPNNYLAWWNLGMINLHYEDWEGVEHAARRGIQLNREDADLFYLLGISYMRRDMMSAAIKNLKKVVKMLPADPGSWYNLAVALAMSGKEDEAETAFEQMEALDPALHQEVIDLMTHRIETGAGPEYIRRRPVRG